MKPKFWKLSHGDEFFTDVQIQEAINDQVVYVHSGTKPLGTSRISQASAFINAPIGDYFYLTHANRGIVLLGQFSGVSNIISKRQNGWIDRPYRLIANPISKKRYTGKEKWWTPDRNSTFTKVPDGELKLFEEYILFPFFGIKLSDYGIK